MSRSIGYLLLGVAVFVAPLLVVKYFALSHAFKNFMVMWGFHINMTAGIYFIAYGCAIYLRGTESEKDSISLPLLVSVGLSLGIMTAFEYSQKIWAYRFFDYLDLVAHVVGVGIAVCSQYLFKK